MNRMTTKLCLGICGGALLTTVMSGCTNSEKEAPTTTPSTTSSVQVTPTEKSLNPTEGNKFTPGIKAPPAPTAIPGSH